MSTKEAYEPLTLCTGHSVLDLPDLSVLQHLLWSPEAHLHKTLSRSPSVSEGVGPGRGAGTRLEGVRTLKSDLPPAGHW